MRRSIIKYIGEFPLTKSALLFKQAKAYSVHFFTASGAVWGFFAIQAIIAGQFKQAILWMVLAMLVDGFDGMLARLVDVKKYASNVDGALMDNIIDYLNYVIVPGFFLVYADFVPAVTVTPIIALILLTSAYQFSQSDAKTDESNQYFFKGFPCYWNVVVIYMIILGWNGWINFAILFFFNVLIFVPVKWIYPSRETRYRKITLGLSYLYGVVGIYGLFLFPATPLWVVYSSFIYVAYYVWLSFMPRK